jgi:tetratricopeptide (TPR) repeat protein
MASLIRLDTSALRCIACLSLLASSAFGAAQKPELEREKAARAKFVEGTKAYNLGQFEVALTAYKEVYDLKPHPGFLFNIAQCYRHLGQFATAAFYYRRYRSEAQLSAADRIVLEELIVEVEDKNEEIERHQRVEAEAARQRELEIARAAALKAALEAEERRLTQMAMVATPLQPPPRGNSILKKWWFWTGVGAVAGGVVYLAFPVHPRNTTMGNINAR